MKEKAHLLIVEDNPDHQELFSDVLGEQYQITFSSSPAECLNSLCKIEIDLILLDYYLQNEYAGLSLLETIRTRYPQIPIIFVTAHGDEEIAATAIKAGAVSYFRKTPDFDYLSAISKNIKELLKQASSNGMIRISLKDFLHEQREEFFAVWQAKIEHLKYLYKLTLKNPVESKMLNELFEAFLADWEKPENEQMLSFFKKMLWSASRQSNTLLLVELLNLSLRETAYEIMRRHFLYSPAFRQAQLEKIKSLIDYNDLRLSKEYEYVVSESTDNMLKIERISTKLLIMRTLQHEIRQPLTFIYNSIELLLNETKSNSAKEALTKVLEQTNKIEKLLSELEKDTEIPLKDYSDQLPIFDLSGEGNEGNA